MIIQKRNCVGDITPVLHRLSYVELHIAQFMCSKLLCEVTAYFAHTLVVAIN